MNRYFKILMAAAAPIVLLLSIPLAVRAQPFGVSSPQPQQQSQYQILSSSNGRFVFGQVSDSGEDKFMLDTFTGRLWRITKTGPIGIFLTPVSYRIADGEYCPIPENISDTKSKEDEKK